MLHRAISRLPDTLGIPPRAVRARGRRPCNAWVQISMVARQLEPGRLLPSPLAETLAFRPASIAGDAPKRLFYIIISSEGVILPKGRSGVAQGEHSSAPRVERDVRELCQLMQEAEQIFPCPLGDLVQPLRTRLQSLVLQSMHLAEKAVVLIRVMTYQLHTGFVES